MSSVCLVTGQFPPQTHGGAEHYVLRTAKELQRRGHEVTILTTEPYDGLDSLAPRETEYEGLPVVRFYPANWSHISEGTGDGLLAKALWHAADVANPHSALATGRALDRIDPDVVHTNNLVGISAGIVPAIRRRSVRHVHTLHDYSLICPRGSLLRQFTAPDDEVEICEEPPAPCRAHARLKRRLVGDPDAVTAPSQHVIDVHEEHGFFRDARTECLPLGIDGDTIADRPTHGVDPAVLFVGNVQRSKGVEVLEEAARRCPDLGVDVCGSGPLEDDIADAADDIDNLRFHGFVSEERLAGLRSEARAAVVPSIWMENSPYVVYESFAAGLPVVGSDVGGIPELVTDGETGRLFEPGDVDALVAALRSVVAPEANDRLARNAIDRAREFTVREHVDRLLAEAYGVE